MINLEWSYFDETDSYHALGLELENDFELEAHIEPVDTTNITAWERNQHWQTIIVILDKKYGPYHADDRTIHLMTGYHFTETLEQAKTYAELQVNHILSRTGLMVKECTE
jgi:hypothetical protein